MNTYRILLVTAGVSILAACGGGGGGSIDMGGTPPTIQGSVSGTATKGPMSGATVAAYAITNGQAGAQIATATTDATGHFTLPVGSYAGPMMLQMTGGTFTDEATGQSVTFGPGDMMTALLPTMTAGANVSGIQVTPVTAMAQSMAQHMTGGMTDANIAAANKAMGTYFSVGDILHTAPMNPLVTGSGTGASQDAQNYGMVMAAMSQYAQSLGASSPAAVVTAMMNDASDGVMDGMMAGGGRVMMGGGMAMSATAGTSGLGGAMNSFMNSAQNKSGVVTTTLMNMLSGSGSTTPPVTNPPPMMNGTVSGSVFDGTMNKATVSAYAINNGAMGAMIASVSTDNQGNFTLPVGTYAGTMMLQVSGGTFTDEATGTTMTMGANDVMSAVLPAMNAGANVSGIWVTPISSVAQSRALGMSGAMTDANIAAANTAVGNYFMMSDILHTQPLNPAIPGSGASASQDARNCGAVLAAISQSAKDQGVPVSSTLVTAMMSDAWDGTMNGMHGGSAVSMSMGGGGMMGGSSGSRTMMTTTGTSGLATAMQEFMSSAVNASGLTAADMAALMTKLTNSSGQI